MERRRVLVTGADGFIGSHLVERLVREGADVRALCMYNSFGHAGWLNESPDEVSDAIDLQFGDVRDAEHMRRVVQGVDTVFHLAALIAIPYSYEAPRVVVETNVTGTLNILEAARESGCRVVHTSTSEVYGTPDTVPITLDHPLRGQSPYAASKIAADKLCEAYARSFDVDVAILRPFNTYGPRQSLRAVIPTVLAQMQSGARVIRLGNLEPKRDFTFVADTVDGFVRMANTPVPPGTVLQLGTGRSVSIGELVEMCGRAVGVSVDVQQDEERVRPEASEVDILLSDPSQAEAELGWTPRTPLESGLAELAGWLAERSDTIDPERYHR